MSGERNTKLDENY